MGNRPPLLSQQPLNVQRATPQWARIGSVTGAASDTTYTDAAGIRWRCVQWTANATSGLVLGTTGMLDALVVGGGGGSSARGGGGAGAVRFGLLIAPSGAHNIIIGAGGATGVNQGANGGDSALGSLLRSGGGGGGYGDLQTAGAFGNPNGGGSGGGVQHNTWGGYVVGGGAGGASWGGTQNGVPVSITGVAIEYGKVVYAAVGDTPGSGGCAAPGASGIVVVRVPA